MRATVGAVLGWLVCVGLGMALDVLDNMHAISTDETAYGMLFFVFPWFGCAVTAMAVDAMYVLTSRRY